MIPVKICGITDSADAKKAEALGAAALGFIFYPKSPRNIEPHLAAEIIEQVSIPTVGVFVNSSLDNINRTIDISGIDMVQLHGSETPEFCSKVKLPVIKAFRVRDGFDFSTSSNYQVKALLLDSYSNESYGGTGEVFDWKLIDKAKPSIPLILAGGLNPGNVTQAVRNVCPAAIDVSSGVESKPGKKDHRKLEALFTALINSKGNGTVFTKRADHER